MPPVHNTFIAASSIGTEHRESSWGPPLTTSYGILAFPLRNLQLLDPVKLGYVLPYGLLYGVLIPTQPPILQCIRSTAPYRVHA